MARKVIITAKRTVFICSRAFAQMPAIAAPLRYIASALRQYLFQTLHNVFSVFIATNAEIQSEFTQNWAIAVNANSHIKDVLSVTSIARLAGPKTTVTAAEVTKTEIAAISMFIAAVFPLIAAP